jgi:hypothetical protein
VYYSINDFPSRDEPLPEHLSLSDLCQHFPKHLIGDCLRRFVKAGWTAEEIWWSMSQVARNGFGLMKGLRDVRARLDAAEKGLVQEGWDKSQVQPEQLAPPAPAAVGSATSVHSKDDEVKDHVVAQPAVLSPPEEFDKQNSSKSQDGRLTETELCQNHPSGANVDTYEAVFGSLPTAHEVTAKSTVHVEEVQEETQRSYIHLEQLQTSAEVGEHKVAGDTLPITSYSTLETQDPPSNDNPASEASPNTTYGSESLQKSLGARLWHIAETNPAPARTLADVRAAIQQEVMQQKGLICGDTLSKIEQNNLMQRVCGARAFGWETEWLTGEALSEDKLSNCKLTDILKRHFNLIIKRLYDHKPPTKGMPPDQIRLHLEQMQQIALDFQLHVLKAWTAQWKAEKVAEEVQVRALVHHEKTGANNTQQVTASPSANRSMCAQAAQIPEEVGRALEVEVVDAMGFAEQSTSSTRPRPQFKHLVHQQSPSHEQLAETSFSGPAYSTSGPSKQPIRRSSVLRGAEINQRQANQWAQSPGSDGHQIPVQQGQTAGASAHVVNQLPRMQLGSYHGGYPAAFGSSQAVSTTGGLNLLDVQTRSPARAMSAAPPTQGMTVQATFHNFAQATMSNHRTQSGPNQRGPKRQRLFIRAPKTDVPLDPLALIDDDEVLRRFPEHLCLKEVMERFIESSRTRSGGYPTAEMTKILFTHVVSKKDDKGPEMTEDQKWWRIFRWVTKEKDACNRKLKKAREASASDGTPISTPLVQSTQSSLKSTPTPPFAAPSVPAISRIAGANAQLPTSMYAAQANTDQLTPNRFLPPPNGYAALGGDCLPQSNGYPSRSRVYPYQNTSSAGSNVELPADCYSAAIAPKPAFSMEPPYQGGNATVNPAELDAFPGSNALENQDSLVAADEGEFTALLNGESPPEAWANAFAAAGMEFDGSDHTASLKTWHEGQVEEELRRTFDI